MNLYKKIIPKNLRLKLLRCLRFIPDEPMIKFQYRIKTGRRLNLKDPKRFTEKLQWYKLYCRNPEMTRCVDKYDVRSYVEELGFGHILNECYGVYDTVEEINFEKLPNQFVLKDTLGSGGHSVILVKDKAAADLDAIKKQLKKWVEHPHHVRGGGREWPYYSGKKHRIIIEKFIDSNLTEGGLIDYKFFCFNGEAKYIYVMADRETTSPSLGIFDAEFHLLPVVRCGKTPPKRAVVQPENFSDMKRIAEKLAADFPQVRIDLYNQDNHILFGEITFFSASGYMKFDPDEFDFEMGKDFELRKC